MTDERRPTIAELEAILARNEEEHTIEILPDGTIKTVEGGTPKIIERPSGPTYY